MTPRDLMRAAQDAPDRPSVRTQAYLDLPTWAEIDRLRRLAMPVLSRNGWIKRAISRAIEVERLGAGE